MINLSDPLAPQWVPVREFESYYEVSELGTVRSLRSGKPLAGIINDKGYRPVTLCGDGVKINVRVHRLVLRAFAGDPAPHQTETRHLDGDKLNNELSNLAWGTPAQNTADKVRHGTANPKDLCSRGHIKSGANLKVYRYKDRTMRVCVICHRMTNHSARQQKKTSPSPTLAR